jgi:hypothetical protein
MLDGNGNINNNNNNNMASNTIIENSINRAQAAHEYLNNLRIFGLNTYGLFRN